MRAVVVGGTFAIYGTFAPAFGHMYFYKVEKRGLDKP